MGINSVFKGLNNVVTVFVVETILFSQFAWVSFFSSSNLPLKHVYMNLPKLSIVCCVSRYVRKEPVLPYIYVHTHIYVYIYIFFFCFVLLTVHLSIILAINQPNAHILLL